MNECQIYELQDKFWNYSSFGGNCYHDGYNPKEIDGWEAQEEYPAKKRRYGFFICDKCHKDFMRKHRFQKMLISKVKSISTLYPFEDLIKTNQDIVDFGAICLMQGLNNFGKARAVELVAIMKEYGYNLNLTGKRTQEGLAFLDSCFKGTHRRNGNAVMVKRRTSAIKSSMKIISILDTINKKEFTNG
tara:strand:+ start:609 stop:1172 length:564 start_codon:yes stop_codon:yes gene_type:complete